MHWVIIVALLGCSKKAEQSPSEQSPPKQTLACDALLTSGDFKEVCGATVVIAKDPEEGKSTERSDYCKRSIATGTEFPFGNFDLSIYLRERDVDELYMPSCSEGTEVQVGDKACMRVQNAANMTDATVKVRKGKVGFAIRAHNEDTVTNPCNRENLVELARRIASRVPK